MNGELISDALGGVLGGVYREYSDQSNRRDKLAEIAEQHRAQQAEVDRKTAKDKGDTDERARQLKAQQDIIESLPDTMPDGSPNQMKIALRVQYASPKGNMGSTILTEDGRNQRWAAPSGNAIANNAGAMDRVGAQIRGALDRTNVEETGRNQRWATASGNATLGADTTRRGQDIGAATTRRGQDIGASTAADRNAVTQRGQDINFGVDTQRNGINANKRSIFDMTFGDQGAGGDPNAPAAAPPPSVPAPALPPRVPVGGGGGVTPQAPAAMARAPIPVTPRAGGPAAAAAPNVRPTGNPALDTLTSQAAAMLSAYNAESNAAKKQQMLKQLQELKARRDALLAGSQQ